MQKKTKKINLQDFYISYECSKLNGNKKKKKSEKNKKRFKKR